MFTLFCLVLAVVFAAQGAYAAMGICIVIAIAIELLSSMKP